MNKCTQVIDQWYWINEEFCCLIESYKTFLLQRPELSGGRGSQDNTSLTWVPHRVPGKELCVTHSLLFFVSKLSKQRDVRRVGRKDPLEKGMATHSSILPWRIPRIEEPGRLQSMGSQRVRHDWAQNRDADFIFRWCLGIVKYVSKSKIIPSFFSRGNSFFFFFF